MNRIPAFIVSCVLFGFTFVTLDIAFAPPPNKLLIISGLFMACAMGTAAVAALWCAITGEVIL